VQPQHLRSGYALGTVKLDEPPNLEEDQIVVAGVARQVPVLRLETARPGGDAMLWPAFGKHPAPSCKQRT